MLPRRSTGGKTGSRKTSTAIAEDVTEDKYRSIKFQDPDGHWIEIS
jgi:hypothetical protein